MDDSSPFIEWMRRRRKACDLSQAELARRVGVAAITIQKIEAGERYPSLQVAILLADQLQIPDSQRAVFIQLARGKHHVEDPTSTIPAIEQEYARLPVPLSSFLGRSHELAELTELLAGGTRLITLSGPGGSGKTRLAIQLATSLYNKYRDNCRFVDLSAVFVPEQVASTIANLLGIPESTHLPPAIRLINGLRSRQILLALDNFEQVVEAAPLLHELLAALPELTLLVTSRVSLRLQGEQEYPVQPLALPPADAPAEEISRAEAVELFAVRARAVRPNFRLTGEHILVVAEICRRLDGLPLAIELAAAHSKLFTAAQLLERLEQHGALMLQHGGQRDLPARQQNVRATIDWSYKLLGPAEQQVFARLGVFVGGFTLQAAEAVAGEPDAETPDRKARSIHVRSHSRVPRSAITKQRASISHAHFLGALAILIEHNLVRLIETETGARYMLLETLREYTLERLTSSGDEEMIRQRHAEYYTDLVELCEPKLFNAEAYSVIRRLAAELNNLRAALEWSISAAPELAGRMCGGLYEFWVTSIYRGDGITLMKRAIAQRAMMSLPIRARLLMATGAMFKSSTDSVSGDIPADALFAETIAIYRQLGDQRGLATALCYYGAFFNRSSNPALSTPLLEESLALAQELGMPLIEGMVLFWMAWKALDQGYPLEQARQFWDRSMAIYDAIGYARGQAMCLFGFSEIAFRLGDYQAAALLQQRRFMIERTIGNYVGMSSALYYQGIIVLADGQLQAAEQLFRAAVHEKPVLDSHLWLCLIAALSGQAANARAEWRRASVLLAQPEPEIILMLIVCAAAVALAEGEAHTSARWCGCVDQQRPTIPLEISLRMPQFDPWLQHLRTQLQAVLTPAEFEAAWEAGKHLSLEQALDEISGKLAQS